MARKKLLLPLISIVLVLVLGVGLFAYHSIRTAVPALAATSSDLSEQAAEFGWNGGPLSDTTKEYLADAMGITVEELQTAIQEARTEALAQAVEKDLITQTQADQITENGKLPFLGRGGFNWLSENGINFNELLANALGISVDKLEAAFSEAFGARIAQAVTDGKLTQEKADLILGRYALYNNSTFQASMKSAYEAAVQQALEDGLITQAQADQLLENMPSFDLGGKRGFGVLSIGHKPHRGEWGDQLEKTVEPGTNP